jgi:uncharacterized membrane protein
MESKWAVGIFTVLALVELVADQLPSAPSRTAPVGLSARIVMGALAGACLAVAGGSGVWLGAFAGAIGGIAGAFGGYQVRTGLVRKLHMKDFMIAIPEDLFAVGIGLILVTRF